ncbi:MAG: Imidazoleglycerol-phosphate dehydratase [Candidatus Thorarchaeota archaeon]|nr:MAG: Imidazoleglycerol-phosphate dehydratase [Candidatus Thorarchaeota archaeon]
MRIAQIERKTRETDISVDLNLDGTGTSSIDIPSAFLSHMLTALSTHSCIDLTIRAEGDLQHHVVEDVAIVFGMALRQAIGDGIGIRRFGAATVPMDCSLARVIVDLVERPYSVIDIDLQRESIEDLASEEILHFLESLVASGRFNLHALVEYGTNDHHKVEAVFKALALALRSALVIENQDIPSSKGVLR